MIDTNYSNCNHTFIDLLNSINSLMWLNVRMCYIRATTMVQFTCLSAHYCFGSSISSKITNYYCRISNFTRALFIYIAYSNFYFYTKRLTWRMNLCSQFQEESFYHPFRRHHASPILSPSPHLKAF